ncbi:probable calcium-binding protein CML25 [Cynara cardunculus var. scolymus]|uniref:Calcium-binding EF-hand n=1 Tax=Cynara cardunculus var. scolymus TaxID=59895 RepID=A0A103XVL4_CYNCS|nr:probable calcium-binding protein CML25 [Cynara cardunculus var. scolymus]KVH97700.1 Calcium-binding EF-hand [Cynara cardunculus var. scolymus]
MGLKNLFNRKKKKKKSAEEDNTTHEHESTLPETNPTKLTPETHRANSLDSRIRIEEELEQVFNKFDVNGDGKICSSELGSIMGSLGHQPTEEELKNMIKEVDADGDGFIDLKEFIELNTKDIDSAEVLENLKDAFSVFDTDKNGLITAEELQNVLGNLGEECAIAESRKMIAGADRDGDGMISFDEFKVMMMVGSHFDSVGSKKHEPVNKD